MKTYRPFSHILLFLASIALFYWACDQPANAQITQINRDMGGQITGTITLAKSNLNSIEKNSVAGVEELVSTHLRVAEYTLEQVPADVGPGVLATSRFAFIQDKFQILSDLSPEFTVVDKGDSYEVAYSFGVVTQNFTPINNLDVLKPYFVHFKKINLPGTTNAWLELTPNLPFLPVVYLTDCDRVFECYDFKSRIGGQAT